VRIEAPAKINLLLRVLHRRLDGYRELETVFQAISLGDTVEVALDRAAASAGVTLEVHGADVGPTAENLAYRAAVAFRDATHLPGAIHIDLVKRIPAGAGLGGGSSDAAAVLRCLARILEATASDGESGARGAVAAADDGSGRVDATTLHRIGAGLGSDVPFFLCGSPLALARGRGEELTPLPPLPEAALVLALPPVHVSTAGAYRALSDHRDEGASGAGGTGLRPRPDAALRIPGWSTLESLAENDFEAVVVRAHPEIARSLEALRAEGARVALLSGSGGASFGLFPSPEEAEAAAARLEARLGWPFLAVRTLERAAPAALLG
jgi:4-diphosphocytidyl-2-C-methyl-D-erythritol kinase